VKVLVEVVRAYRLILDTKFHLNLIDTCCVPSITRHLVYLSKLNVVGYSFTFGNMIVLIYINVLV